jgi:hypothetical protein
MPPETPNLANRLFIPVRKTRYVFEFLDKGDLKSVASGRGAWIFYSPLDYDVERDRQIYHGRADER